MRGFLVATLPWLCIGMALVLCAVNFSIAKKGKKKQRNTEIT